MSSIDDGAFVLVWADDEPGDGAMHAGFQLDPAAGDLFLYADGHLESVKTQVGDVREELQMSWEEEGFVVELDIEG